MTHKEYEAEVEEYMKDMARKRQEKVVDGIMIIILTLILV